MLRVWAVVCNLSLASACARHETQNSALTQSAGAHPTPPATPSRLAIPSALPQPRKIERKQPAMGTLVHLVSYSSERSDPAQVELAFDAALREMDRLELLLSEWRADSEVGRINQSAGQWVSVSSETLQLLQRAAWASTISGGAFDVSFQVLSSLWKFGSAQSGQPRVPTRPEVERLRRYVDYRKIDLDPAASRVRIQNGMQIGLGGIAKGYIVDRASNVLKQHGLNSFLVQAGGDLYGAGRKPDGSPWVSGIQDPRGPQGTFFATLELEDHAFSTAGDYARTFSVDGKRYHHILDPRTGFPATACRSVTVFAEDALTADAVDDAVFILGPERGLKLADSLPGVGIVIVDAHNKVWSNARLKDKLKVLSPPTNAP